MPEPGTQYDNVSFYRGTTTVILKNHLFEPSSAMCHAVEELNTINVLKYRVKEYIVKYKDGGPDQRTNFITVILTDIAQWMVGDFNILVHFRTPAELSIGNPAERLMSVLNLALYGVACSRHKLSEENETILNPLDTKSNIRDAKGDAVKKLIEETAQPVIDMLNLRFRRLTYDGKPMNAGKKATTDSITAMMGQLFWLAVLYIVVRLALADSKAVLLAYYASLRLFSCSCFIYILRSAVAQPNLLARRSLPLMSGLPRRRRGCG
jgi:hypothetical protein